jgi:signal transduction histidine kinase
VDLDWVFSVHDNGPGIEPAFQGRIFEAFKGNNIVDKMAEVP